MTELPDLLRRLAREAALEKGRFLFYSGEPAAAVYRVLAGEVHLLRHGPDGGAVVVQRARPGDFLAEASLFSDRYHCDALCVRPSRCLRLPADTLAQALAAQPGFALEWVALLSRHLRLQRAAQERLALRSTRARIVHYLVERGEDGRVTLEQPLTHWAQELGVSREALYRTLAKMEREGMLRREARTLALI